MGGSLGTAAFGLAVLVAPSPRGGISLAPAAAALCLATALAAAPRDDGERDPAAGQQRTPGPLATPRVTKETHAPADTAGRQEETR
ncbi:hypothetical protein [Streptomyces sp. MP131-18]|uniref:hypothetical protein n=1 Tax=Streptomyces sp. MP131-18 TaxID=1857892 RepID=UPI00097C2C36|nr:hypothetical protein [Streptomyces sp. MP131-18]ONK15954.1 hypothetical protein STBA_67970 [Streptomyces sp. MP131-18]